MKFEFKLSKGTSNAAPGEIVVHLPQACEDVKWMEKEDECMEDMLIIAVCSLIDHEVLHAATLEELEKSNFKLNNLCFKGLINGWVNAWEILIDEISFWSQNIKYWKWDFCLKLLQIILIKHHHNSEAMEFIEKLIIFREKLLKLLED